MIRRPPVLLLAVAPALAAACGERPPPAWHEGEGHRWRELRVERGDGPGFTPLSPSRTGIEFANVLGTARALENEHRLIGSGVALGDVDGDGRTDVYLARLEGPNVLYRNLGDWRFEDVTDHAGVAAPDRYSTGAVMADVDGDGDLDLLLASLGGPDVLFRNDGVGRFSEERAGLPSGDGTTTLALADVDGDGDLDLYRTTYKRESATDRLRMLERSPSEITEGSGDSLRVAPGFREHYRIEVREGRRVAVEQAEPDRLHLNDGTGRFEEVSWTGGAFLDEEGAPLGRAIDDFGLAARFTDLDGDGDPDLYVCNDFDDPDRLWINRGDGTFREVPRLALRTTSHASMSVDFADVDRDGRTDFFVAEMRPRSLERRLLQVPFHAPHRKPPGRIRDRPQVQRNTLFLSRGEDGFAEIGQLAGVDASDWTWGSVFLDVDLDGYEDLIVANGYSRDTQHGDVVERISALQGRATSREIKRLYPELPNRNAAFRNRGDLTFRDVGEEWGVGLEEDVSHGLATGDLDGDGDLDVVVNRLGHPARVLRNDAGRGRVAVRLRGARENTRGIGAKVRILGGPVPVQEQEMTAGGLYLSGEEALLVFATGNADSLALEVEWPAGGRSVIRGVRPDRLYEVREEGASATGGRAAAPGPAEPPDAAGNPPAPLFVDRSELLGHRHPESSFGDFDRQPLLPYRPGRLGPGVSWTDLDGDGDPDLVVPPGSGGRIAHLRNDGDGFTEVPLEASPGSLDRTAALPFPGPDGATRLLVGQSNFEAPGLERARERAAAVWLDPSETPSAPRPLAPSGNAATGPLAQADVDGDGDLDLFLGGRTIRGFYPLPATSRLFRNEGGELVPDPRNRETLEDLGLVSGATFTDVDGDGDPDLVLALEWGPVRLLENEGGRLRDATARWGLDDLEGRWNGVAAGDLDGDGRMDLVVTGRGRNLRDRPEPGRPLVLFHGDLDRNGVWDLLPARREREDGPLRPLHPYALMRAALPSLRSRVDGYEAYAGAGLREILGVGPEEVLAQVARRYEHLVLLNRGGRFEAVPLPTEAQISPALGVAVGDLDGDGREDVFLAQNFFPTRLDLPRHDAGLGLVLLGDGEGGLRPLPPARSGIRIHGDSRGAALADYDRDGRVDLAVAQNGGRTRLFRNEGAEPGLRVRLRGPAANPRAVGATVRVEHADGLGPAREVRGGSGYWSLDGAVQVLGLPAPPEAVRIRWPDGTETRVPVAPGARTVVADAPEGG